MRGKLICQVPVQLSSSFLQLCPTTTWPILVLMVLVPLICVSRTKYSAVKIPRGVAIVKGRFIQSLCVPHFYSSMTKRVAYSPELDFRLLRQLEE